MATIHVSDWTKRILDELKEVEQHTSHDSVIKSLIFTLDEETKDEVMKRIGEKESRGKKHG